MIWTFDYPLRTARLDLRPHTAADLDDLVVFHSDPEVVRYIPWTVRDRQQTHAALALKIPQVSAAAAGEWIVLAIEERSSHTVIGEILLKRRSDTVAEIGYVLASDAQGTGLASEAVAHLMAVSEQLFAISRFGAVTETPNVASQRLLTRAGFVAVPPTEPGLLSFERRVVRPSPG